MAHSGDLSPEGPAFPRQDYGSRTRRKAQGVGALCLKGAERLAHSPPDALAGAGRTCGCFAARLSRRSCRGRFTGSNHNASEMRKRLLRLRRQRAKRDSSEQTESTKESRLSCYCSLPTLLASASRLPTIPEERRGISTDTAFPVSLPAQRTGEAELTQSSGARPQW